MIGPGSDKKGVALNSYLSTIKPWQLTFKFNFQAQLSGSLFAKIVAQNFSIYHALAFWFSFNPLCDALNVPKLVVVWLLDCWWGEELEDIKGNELGPSTLMSFIIGSAATGIVIVFLMQKSSPSSECNGRTLAEWNHVLLRSMWRWLRISVIL